MHRREACGTRDVARETTGRLVEVASGTRACRALLFNLTRIREGLAIDVGRSIPARRVIRVLEELIALHGRPAALRMDNGPQLTAEAFVQWCDEQRIALRYIQPGKPDQNAFIERFNRSYRTEVLDAYLFESPPRSHHCVPRPARNATNQAPCRAARYRCHNSVRG